MAKRKAVQYEPQPITLDLLKAVAKMPTPERPREIRDSAGSGLVLRHEPKTGNLNFYIQVARSKRARPWGKRCDARRVIDGKPTLATVKTEARRLRAAYDDGIDIAADRRAEKAVPTLTAYIDDVYEPWALDERPQSGADTVARLKACFAKDFGNTQLHEITKAKAAKWKAKRRRKGVIGETINRDLGALRAALYRAVDLEIIKQNPLAGVEMAKVDRNKRVIRALDEDEKARLVAALEDRDAAKREARASGNQWREKRGKKPLPVIGRFCDVLTPAAIVSLETGLRRGELFALQWPMVDFKDRTIRIKGPTTKSYLTRDIPMNATARAALRDWWLQRGQPKTGYVFTANGRPVKNLRHSYNKILDEAGIERINAKGEKVDWHSLRHTFGTLLGAARVDVVTIKELMGHADLRTTSRYLKSDEKRKLDAVEQLAGAS